MNPIKRINLALQGGGSHGAFTWGVLDALIEDGRLSFEAVSGTSAGAMNAAIVLQGWAKGGPDGARKALADFWTELGTFAVASPIRRTPLDRLQGNWNLDESPTVLWADVIQRTLSPWQRNPLNFDPLRDLLRKHFDEKAVRACSDIKAFVAATNVETGKVRIFKREELSIDALLASACLPNVHDAVVIDGVPYWDGGYRGNPPIWPFIYESETRDVVLVELDPAVRKGVPRSNAEIADRLNEITFGGALMAEMRAIAFVQDLIRQGAITGTFGTRLKMMLIHSINDDASLAPLGAVSKFNIEPDFLEHLFQLGRAAATRWLASTFDSIGVETSIDIAARFL
ncbi:patatin-like phospholipase family protein [Enhydrobacter sp.]|jgi:NTE family protein|uniref:patatin-like phospholipase family protein n=1 Tax=Enhydrobacter sp. TaxID=1894999 RepID=UPI0026111ABC|nr:patatin-like phospholipase family protein [Enhydrobacter sp.]WIM14175.1 MAG: Ferredoxin reductase [Enhydrobacter sp.]